MFERAADSAYNTSTPLSERSAAVSERVMTERTQELPASLARKDEASASSRCFESFFRPLPPSAIATRTRAADSLRWISE
eukprot:scaffold1610_cov257-Pinguiococcus_pyrenoidosus.AAC.10